MDSDNHDVDFLQEKQPAWGWWPERLRLTRWRGLVVTILLLFTLIAGAVALDNYRNTVHERERAADQVEARLAACRHDNDQAHVQIVAEETEIRLLIGRFTERSTIPGLAAQITAFYAEYDKLVVQAHPIRVCTLAGINAYLSTTTTEGP